MYMCVYIYIPLYIYIYIYMVYICTEYVDTNMYMYTYTMVPQAGQLGSQGHGSHGLPHPWTSRRICFSGTKEVYRSSSDNK